MTQRIFSALIMIALVLGAIFYFPPTLSFVGLLILALIFVYEVSQLLNLSSYIIIPSAILLLLVALFPHFLDYLGHDYGMIPLLYLTAIISFKSDNTIQRCTCFIIILAMIFKLLGATLFLYSNDKFMLIALLASIALCDSCAYFAGKLCGKHLLLPSVSPKKTWEGVLGGFIGVLIFLMCSHTATWDILFASAAVISVVSIVGDLLQSVVKRKMGKKDSGDIIPGHGGIYDRLDSHLLLMAIVQSLLTFHLL